VNKLKPYCKLPKIIQTHTFGIAIVSIKQGYSRQHRMIGALSAAADFPFHINDDLMHNKEK